MDPVLPETLLCIDLQYEAAGRRIGVDSGVISNVVAEWMQQRPLRHLLACRRAGVVSFLDCCQEHGVLVGAYSDYPTRGKVEALQLSKYFDLHLCSTDGDINAFKPSPAGILHACRRWQLDPDSVLYVGDREDVDGKASRAAKTRFVLMGRDRSVGPAIKDFSDLKTILGWV